MAAWFAVLAVAGLVQVVQNGGVLAALNPLHAVRFLFGHGSVGFLVLGSVFLAMTGAEALYADMGHFGRGPIRLGWSSFVLPALALNHFGQGALVLAHPDITDMPFFKLFPGWALVPVVALATATTVIASQAVITEQVPFVQGAQRMTVQPLDRGFTEVTLRFGFAEAPDVPAALEAHRAEFPIDIPETSFFLGRETPVPTMHPELSWWRERLYAFMTRNAVSAASYFQILPKRVVELGTQVEL